MRKVKKPVLKWPWKIHHQEKNWKCHNVENYIVLTLFANISLDVTKIMEIDTNTKIRVFKEAHYLNRK